MFDSSGRAVRRLAIRAPAVGRVVASDLDRDGCLDFVWAGADGVVSAIDGRARPLEGWPVRLEGYPIHLGATESLVTLADLDADGRLELLAAGGAGATAGGLHVYRLPSGPVVKAAVVRCSYSVRGR